MDERTKQMIKIYIPNPRDETLGFNEYYYRQYTNAGDRVIKVVIQEILPHEDTMEYGIYQERGHRLVRIDNGWGSPFRGVTMGYLYDNKEDCRHGTHDVNDRWEALRKAQEEAQHEEQ